MASLLGLAAGDSPAHLEQGRVEPVTSIPKMVSLKNVISNLHEGHSGPGEAAAMVQGLRSPSHQQPGPEVPNLWLPLRKLGGKSGQPWPGPRVSAALGVGATPRWEPGSQGQLTRRPPLGATQVQSLAWPFFGCHVSSDRSQKNSQALCRSWRRRRKGGEDPPPHARAGAGEPHLPCGARVACLHPACSASNSRRGIRVSIPSPPRSTRAPASQAPAHSAGSGKAFSGLAQAGWQPRGPWSHLSWHLCALPAPWSAGLRSAPSEAESLEIDCSSREGKDRQALGDTGSPPPERGDRAQNPGPSCGELAAQRGSMARTRASQDLGRWGRGTGHISNATPFPAKDLEAQGQGRAAKPAGLETETRG